MFTKQHFEAIADIIKSAQTKYRGCTANELYNYIAEDFADYLEGQNERFNRDKFYQACGLEA